MRKQKWGNDMPLPTELQAHPSDVHAQSRSEPLCCSPWGLWMECASPDGLTVSIWGILTKGNMMLCEAMKQEAKRFSPSAQCLWEGRRRWSWKPQEQLMALP